jgi:hypothetical protein
MILLPAFALFDISVFCVQLPDMVVVFLVDEACTSKEALGTARLGTI